MRPAGVAPSHEGAPGPGEARLLASGALVQQIAQASGLLVLLVIVTVLARRLSVADLGAYGLVASLAGYLLVLRNSVASSAVRAMASALDRDERGHMFSAAAALYAVVGVATGVLIALAALAIGTWILDGELGSDARAGGAGLGLLTAFGIAASVNLDALRAERLFVRGAVTEIVAVSLYLALMLALILGGADLAWVIACSGAIPLPERPAVGGRGAALGRAGELRRGRSHARAPHGDRADGGLAPRRRALEPRDVRLQPRDPGRLPLAHRRSGSSRGRVRAHNLLYALGGALAVPVVPTASRYVAGGEEHRLRELALRGTRYTLALFVPLSVTLMVLAEPILEVWLGDRYGGGATALAILVSYWLLYGGLVVTPGFLVGAGRARTAGLVFACAAVLNLALSLVLTPELGIEGPALGTAIPFFLAFPLLLRAGLSASGAPLRELARRAWLPSYSLGLVLAGVLVAVRLGLEPESLPAVLATAAGGVLAYWAAFYGIVLSASERALFRG